MVLSFTCLMLVQAFAASAELALWVGKPIVYGNECDAKLNNVPPSPPKMTEADVLGWEKETGLWQLDMARFKSASELIDHCFVLAINGKILSNGMLLSQHSARYSNRPTLLVYAQNQLLQLQLNAGHHRQSSSLIYADTLQAVFERKHNELAEKSSLVLQKAALYIAETHFSVSEPNQYFTPAELLILKQHSAQLKPVIETTLSLQDSVGAAYLLAQLGMIDSAPALRKRFLTPGREYGWEGPEYNQEADFLDDGQFVFHNPYLKALEQLHQQKITQLIELTPAEQNTIIQLSRNQNHSSYYWAKWMRIKLAL